MLALEGWKLEGQETLREFIGCNSSVTSLCDIYIYIHVDFEANKHRNKKICSTLRMDMPKIAKNGPCPFENHLKTGGARAHTHT